MFVNDKKNQLETRNNIAFMKIKINQNIYIYIIRKTSEILSEIF